MRLASPSTPNSMKLVRFVMVKIPFLAVGLLVLGSMFVGSGETNEILAACVNSVEPRDDLLAYALWDSDNHKSFWLYDPNTHVSKDLGVEADSTTFSFSSDGYLAYSLEQEDNAQLYLLNTFQTDSPPIAITQHPTSRNYPLSWSPDGRYLAFESNVDEEKQIYVWDGTTVINITPPNLEKDVQSYWEAWSNDNRLAFVAYIGSSTSRSEIYIWDGATTTSLSQNPSGEDIFPAWSVNGQVAYTSERDGEYDIYVWDGISIENGSPARATFTNILPKLSEYYSHPIWTYNGCLSFVSTGPEDFHAQTYLWNGQTATNISQNPTLHNGNASWSPDGRWAFTTFFSSEQLLYVRDADNQTLLAVEGQYTPIWSSNGDLGFCTRATRGWALSIWDGQNIRTIAEGREIWAQWQSGDDVACSSG